MFAVTEPLPETWGPAPAQVPGDGKERLGQTQYISSVKQKIVLQLANIS